jgi:uncharacterized protein
MSASKPGHNEASSRRIGDLLEIGRSAGNEMEADVMGKLLVHVTHGSEAQTRAALAFLVAKAAADAGHDVTMFLAGDAAPLIKDEVVAALRGIGTGELSHTLPAIVEAGVPIFVSGMSATGRGVTEADLDGKNATFAKPEKLVELAFEADRVLTY